MDRVDMLRIAMIDPSAFTIPYDRHLCSSLGDAGHDTILFTRQARENDYFKSGDDTTEDFTAQSFITDELFYRGSQRSHGNSYFRRLRLAAKATEHIRNMRRLCVRLQEFQPTTIHFQWLVLPAIDVHFVKKLRKLAPVFLTVHDAEAFHSPSSKLQLFGWARSLANFDGLIAHTGHTRKCLEDMGIASTRIKEVPHGLLCHNGTNPAKTPNCSSSAEDILRLLFFGSIKPYKGLDVLIRALSLVPPAIRQRLRLRVAGNPDLPERELHQLAAECGVEQQIEWQLRFFRDEELDRIFHGVDAVVYPYRRIDASGALMTAVPYGKAIIASHVGQFGELLENRRSAMLVSPDDPGELARAITDYASDSQLRLELAAGIENVGRSIPLWKNIAETTVDFYRRHLPR